MYTILTVHDDPLIRNQLIQTLMDARYLVLEARNAAEAISIARDYSGKIDLLILENTLGNGSLSEIVRAIARLHPNIRFLMITDLPEEQVAMETELLAGKYQVLRKPWAPPVLIERVRRVLTRSGSA